MRAAELVERSVLGFKSFILMKAIVEPLPLRLLTDYIT